MTIANILESISLIIAAWTVIYGVTAWRREFVGKRRIELAEEVLALFYEAGDIIRYIRNPLGFGGEGTSRKASDTESPEEKQVKDREYIVFERYNKYQELFNKIHSMRYRFMAQFGNDAAQPFDDLRKIVNDIFVSAHRLTHYGLQQGRRTWSTDEEFKKHIAKMNKDKAVLWEEASETDPILPRVNEVISNIDTRCRAIIGEQILPRRLWNWICSLCKRES